MVMPLKTTLTAASINELGFRGLPRHAHAFEYYYAAAQQY